MGRKKKYNKTKSKKKKDNKDNHPNKSPKKKYDENVKQSIKVDNYKHTTKNMDIKLKLYPIEEDEITELKKHIHEDKDEELIIKEIEKTTTEENTNNEDLYINKFYNQYAVNGIKILL